MSLGKEDHRKQGQRQRERPRTSKLNREAVETKHARRAAPDPRCHPLGNHQDRHRQHAEDAGDSPAPSRGSQPGCRVPEALKDDRHEQQPGEERAHREENETPRLRRLPHANQHGQCHVDDENLKSGVQRAHSWRKLGLVTMALASIQF